MTTPVITTDRQRELIERLRRLVEMRAKEEVEIHERHADRQQQARERNQHRRDRLTADFEGEHARLIEGYKRAREAVLVAYEAAGAALVVEEEQYRERAADEHAQMLEDAKSAWQLQAKHIEETHVLKEATRNTALAQFHQECDELFETLKTLAADAEKFVRRRGFVWPEMPAPAAAAEGEYSHKQRFELAGAALLRARDLAGSLPHQPADKFLQAGWPVLIFLLAIPVAALLSWWLFAGLGWGWIVAGGLLLPLAISIVVRQSVRPVARRQIMQLVPPLQESLALARQEAIAAKQAANLDALRRKQRRGEKRQAALAQAKRELEVSRQQEVALYQSSLEAKSLLFQEQRKTVEESHEQRLTELDSLHPPQIEKLEHEFQRLMLELGEQYRAEIATVRQEFQEQWSALVARWSKGLAEFQTAIGQMNDYCDAHFPAWNSLDPSRPPSSNGHPANGQPAGEDVAALRFGSYSLNLESQEGGMPHTEGLAMPPAAFELPAVLSFPGRPSLLLEAEGEGRDEANRTLQNVMLRLLTAFPPGKVRFTIVDPIGLGQNFSAFMHLADFDPRLVSNRIWTESAHINQRLADLTEHMEDVIQKYLRNEFDSIQQYNQQAGEVAEPFQILVVANFPANFSEDAARRLVSIATSGARCGVYTLISTDNRLKLPRNFDPADLEGPAAALVWDAERARFAWKQPDLKHLPLSLESPPAGDRLTEIVRAVGQRAVESSRVEVPFEAVLPSDESWWSGDSRSEIEAPLGRAGAMKLQTMKLGRGTSQHVLIAGKTGSGKSTLLNALITNLAAHYSPEELQFYLIDFKKGVEFKAYATHRLPHARVIAIESEREFGMSVLERLDQELKRRGDLLRQAGVQDLKGYRNANPTAVMPRVLLIIDEFQEFFTSDDKISHDAGLLLDRLVRQGRAFGIHVLLGSQTLAGAYSLARSTIGQMAVRIALQCSESDAHLILSEDNSAARLLSRPGEAIYNDANGLLEGNHPFQVVWLSDFQRETYLQRIAALAVERRIATPPPTVFEGNAAADPADNYLLQTLLESQRSQEIPLAPRAWLGAAVAIKDPTDVVFRRQGGGNLLIVGQQEELALGILASSLVSLASQAPLSPCGRGAGGEGFAPGDGPQDALLPQQESLPTFHILDGSRPESPQAGFWRRVVGQLPIAARVATPRDAGESIRRIASEVERRLAEGEASAPPIFLVVDNLARFRDLKKSEDFSFGDDGGEGASKQLTTILREGPALGVHTLLWCDSYNNVNRWLDRQTLRDLDHRVLFQMSAADSSNLMDSPAAARLGAHLALYHSEELGRAEKFRPYGLPTAAWLSKVAQRLANHSVVTDPAPDSSAAH